jgi:hypothetical protein
MALGTQNLGAPALGVAIDAVKRAGTYNGHKSLGSGGL